MITISQLNIYPIKSCRGVSLQSAQLEERGLQYDRRWMLVDGQQRFLTQREWPRMALIAVEIKSDHLRVSAPAMPPLSVPIRSVGNQHQLVNVWADHVLAADVGDDAGGWFSEFLGLPCRLVHMPDTAERVATRKGVSSQVSFADAYPLLLISEASLAELNSRLDEPLPMKRFRPNLVVRGCTPYEEDTWNKIVAGGVTLHVVKPCTRCVIPTIDPDTGIKSKEPTRTLATYRARDGKVMFGQNVIHEGMGRLCVGEEGKIVK
ncbi:MAG: MOSC N-terminal beta barrel domain-containing protein [Bacteroidota bacterium]